MEIENLQFNKKARECTNAMDEHSSIAEYHQRSLPDDWVKINVDALNRHSYEFDFDWIYYERSPFEGRYDGEQKDRRLC